MLYSPGPPTPARSRHPTIRGEAESAGFDPSAGILLSEGYDATVNTRGLVFIESPDPKIGMVCVIPLGITEMSSVTGSRTTTWAMASSSTRSTRSRGVESASSLG